MVQQPKLGVVYKVTIDRMQRIPLYKVTMHRRTIVVSVYNHAGWIEQGEIVVFIDTFKSRQGHNEIYAITSSGQAGWVALQVREVRLSMNLIRQKTDKPAPSGLKLPDEGDKRDVVGSD
jgi:hypothetical protein